MLSGGRQDRRYHTALKQMERFNARALRDFTLFCMRHDPQILANRREARALYYAALSDDGDFGVSADKADKLEAFLCLNDGQVHHAAAENTVSVYAFVKILAELRRRLRDLGLSPGGTPNVPSGGSILPREHAADTASTGGVE